MSYKVPVDDINFNLKAMGLLEQIQALSAYEEISDDLVDAIIEENSRLVEDEIAPLNVVGDQDLPSCEQGEVSLSKGFKEALALFAEGGWQSLAHGPEFGGQGFPKLISTVIFENLNAANMAFALCPILTDGCIEAINQAGTEEQKQLYIPPMVEGRWTGTMNLTEPQAGSDLALLKSRAVRQDDGSYRISGQKIFITWGEHNASENIIHLVLARTPDAPAGVKGISLFVVPKFLVNEDGSLGKRNDVVCASLEHKLGIHGSPTAVMVFGDNQGEVGEGAIGYLIGEENDGLRHMFVMMNEARFAIGLQGTAISERALQMAWAYAQERLQGNAVEGGHRDTVAINQHPDVRRMLMTIKSLTEGSRATALYAASCADLAKHHEDSEQRAHYQAIYEYLVPIVKGFATEMAQEATSLALQVHGGMGYIEETGVAQLYRDARILPIYEGTTAIQANDIIGRKTMRDEGAVAKYFVAEILETASGLAAHQHADLKFIGKALQAAAESYAKVVDSILSLGAERAMRQVFTASVSYLMLAGYMHTGWQLARQALVAAELDNGNNKIATALFYAAQILPRVDALANAVFDSEQCVRSFEGIDFDA
ncbi:Acyl-CoA dehydrogenase, short-chain specific [Oligella urethralis]|uniref:acyl-CoA dehydrogenase n=1 Tax=Oligella urethralis TaxID=90245 RepID=UPI000E03B700|nr:acyl-CoA dehydrogenase [Oligella urethralis]SUA60981.1 Acyl-CoA dehydrogenase, short-chain specific [Oligella urethralis]